jgi:hypothetical protein
LAGTIEAFTGALRIKRYALYVFDTFRKITEAMREFLEANGIIALT